jgi:hypothetical protein
LLSSPEKTFELNDSKITFFSKEKDKSREYQMFKDKFNPMVTGLITKRNISFPHVNKKWHLYYDLLMFGFAPKNSSELLGKKWIQGTHMKKGAFTRKAKEHNMTPAEFQSEVLSHPDNFSPRTVKQANLRKTLVHLDNELPVISKEVLFVIS